MTIVFSVYHFNLFGQIKLVSGFKDATYHKMSKDISKISTQTVTIINTDGALENFKLLMKDECDVAFIQYDVMYFEKENNSENSTKLDDIKILLPLGYEEIHLIVLKESGIKTLEDLADKKVAVGTKNQGTYVTAKYIKTVTKIKWKDVTIGFNDALEALITGDIDAFFFVGSAPVEKLADIPDNIKDKITLLPLTHPKLENYYTLLSLKKSTYSWLKEDIVTYGVRYALATNSKNESDTKFERLKKLVEDIRQNYDKLTAEGHEQWKDVDFKFENVKWPIHPVTLEIFQLKKL